VRAGIRPGDVYAVVASLSAHLGWDLTLGATKNGGEKDQPIKSLK